MFSPAADGRAGGSANLAHGVDVLGRHRFLEPQQLEVLDFLGDALTGGGVVARVHIHGEVDVLGIVLAREGDLGQHVIDLGVVGGPVDAIEARRVGGIVDIDLGGGETQLLNLLNPREGALVAGDHLPVAGIAVDAYAVPHLAAHQLIHRHTQRLAGNVPERRFDGRQGGDILPGLRAGEDARGADALKGGLNVQGILANQQPSERADQRHVALRGVGRFALADDALVRVDAHVDLVAVDPNFGGANLRDLQLGAPVGTGRALHRLRKRR
jgi:hypothetical protein